MIIEVIYISINNICCDFFTNPVMFSQPNVISYFPVKILDNAIGVFLRHIEEVKQYVAAEKLLVYNVKEGWEPLCAFLGVEVPAEKPFPHDNDRANFVGDARR